MFGDLGSEFFVEEWFDDVKGTLFTFGRIASESGIIGSLACLQHGAEEVFVCFQDLFSQFSILRIC